MGRRSNFFGEWYNSNVKKLSSFITRRNATFFGAILGAIIHFPVALKGFKSPEFFFDYFFYIFIMTIFFRGIVILFFEKFSWKKILITLIILVVFFMVYAIHFINMV